MDVERGERKVRVPIDPRFVWGFCMTMATIRFFFTKPMSILVYGSIALRLTGILLFGSGIVLYVLATRVLSSHHTSMNWGESIRTLVTVGVYSRTRNPQFLSFVLVGLGVSFVMNTWGFILLLIPFIAYVQLIVIPAEEKALMLAFKEDYKRYRDETPQWLMV
eukprot:GILJ01015157.1.p1 GENE.GILJ01015157.1~~GILJ01015157.1.p1  ORF type:complete len:163 (+),score=12.96 GILJ01015157.1:39-527(+)